MPLSDQRANDLRTMVASLLDVPPATIDGNDSVIELGMDSIAMMRLAGMCRKSGLDVSFADLAADPSLRAWERLIAGRQDDSGSASRPAEIDEAAPFGLALMQHAYWVGRSQAQQLGGVAAHFYNEFDGTDVDPARLERAVRAVVARHGMLRVRILDDGRQLILPESPWPGLRVHDLRDLPAERAEAELAKLRVRLSHRQLDIAAGEVFDIQLSLLPNGTRLHLNLDMVAADALSLRVLLADLARGYEDGPESLAPLGYSYPRYLADRAESLRAPARAAALDADRAYWRDRLPDLPAAPELPAAGDVTAATTVRRRHRWLDAEQAGALRQHSQAHGLTPAMALAAVFAEVLTAWSAEPRFLLNLPLFNREPLHPDVDALVGDFTSSVLLAWDGTTAGSFADRARALQRRFQADAAHSAYSGVEVLRDASRLHGRQVLAPVVYTSALGLGELFAEPVRRLFGEASWIISQGPQVWLDAQVTELHGGLLVNWDAREDAFAPGVLDAMFAAYGKLLDRLVGAADAWSQAVPPLLPDDQLAVRTAVNDTAAPRSGNRLHDRFFAHARRDPDAPALLWGRSGVRGYGELAERALRVAGFLRTKGIGAGDLVAVSLPKGPDQVVAVLGVLAAGAAYLPIGVDQPQHRRERILASAKASLLLDELPDGEPLPAPATDDDDTALAYVLYTSGSTGEPKGVEVTHAAAMNTIDDLVERFEIGAGDRTLALSALEFDLSVFDLFAPLSAGGAVVCVDEAERRDSAAWAELIRRHDVTVLNCVPVLLDVLLPQAQPGLGLRAVLLGGDWVTADLPGRLRAVAPDCRFAGLGGTTETAIHSTVFEVGPAIDPVANGWAAIPYGRPLRNVACRVVDPLGRDCPDWVAGELWIGGAGVARGYRNDPERTAEKFVTIEDRRWYKTGDRARYWPDGTLEFLGRADHQVKIRGHRIELGEIEAALRSYEGIEQAVAVVADARLGAVVTGDVDVAALREHVAGRLPGYLVPDEITVLPALPLTPNGKVDRAALARIVSEAAGQRLAAATPPVGEVERRVAAAWSDLLGVPDVGREHDFFSLGGDSLLATRLIGLLRTAGLTGVSLSALLANPVLADFAATLRLGDTGAEQAAQVVPDPDHRHEPFLPTDVQRAYWLGRNAEFTLGGIGCHFYREYDVTGLDLGRLEAAVNALIGRHEMLRAVFDADGNQRILREVPRYAIPVMDAGSDPAGAFAKLRLDMSHIVFDPAAWPLFAIRAVRAGDTTRLGIGVDNLVLDALSILTFYSELGQLYEDPAAALPPVEVSFRDYVLSARPAPEALEAAEAYWTKRLDDLPPAPRLPLAVDPEQVTVPRFSRREFTLDAEHWRPIADRARDFGMTPSAVLLAAFAEVLDRWSTGDGLTLNITLFDRRQVHAHINHVLGDFTSLLPIACRREGTTWRERVRSVQRELWAALDHRDVSTVWVVRELARRTGQAEVMLPVVFTSALGVGAEPEDGLFADQVWGVSQTPQVWLDHQVTEVAGGVRLNWDVVDELFPDGLVDAMFGAYRTLVSSLATMDWDAPTPDLLPTGQVIVRERVNATGGPVPDRGLHQGFFERASAQPGRLALLWDGGAMTYGELADRSLRVAAGLRGRGVRPGEPVAVTVPKGPDQIVAVLGVLAAGGAYVPVGVDQPAARRYRMLSSAGVRQVVTASGRGHAPLAGPVPVDPDALAYVIFTSGSTGEPKGVEITHRAAANTVDDINTRFAVGPADRVLAVSALDFDLSVYDIFGPLSAGGAVVLIEEADRRDAQRWRELVDRYGVTIWNSVPALLDMLLTVGQDEPFGRLRLVLASGDWVGLDLPGRLADRAPGCRFVALGGATEASIWSNAFEVDAVEPAWRSIPYGYPLRNQRYRVVDEHGRDCPDWVPGELWIGGTGVARGYRNDPARTAERFVTVDGGRWYRTGDQGRYWPDGTLEFLGRTDNQVKLRGHRIELGEVEAALRSAPGVGRAVAMVDGNRLLAAVVPAVAPGTVTECLEPSAELVAERARAGEVEAAAAQAFLVRLLDRLCDQEVADEHAATVQLWRRWLAGRETAAAYEPADASGDYDRLVARAYRRLLDRLDDYRAILTGRLDANVLLDDDVVAPMALAAADPSSGPAGRAIEAELAALAAKLGRPPEVAELDGTATRVAPADRFRYDAVIARNTLHRYRETGHGPALARLLVRPGGLLLAVERETLTPLAMLTAGLLDRGWVDLDPARRQAGNPMLTGRQWADALAAAGWNDVRSRHAGTSHSVLLHAVHPSSALDPETLRRHAVEQLPAPMVPESIEVLPWLPLTANGKVDRSAIVPNEQAGASDEPQGELEVAVADLWAELLERPAVGRDDNFFEAGGDSLLATRFVELAKQRLGVTLPLRKLFADPTVAAVARALNEASPEERTESTAVEEGVL